MLPPHFLTLGIRGMARAVDTLGWNTGGHFGAAMIAAYFFCRENNLDRETCEAVQRQAEMMAAKFPALFVEQPVQPSRPSLLENLCRTMEANIFRVVALGHNAIFGMLALKALKEQPESITEASIDGLCRLQAQFTQMEPMEAIFEFDTRATAIESDPSVPHYQNAAAIARFAFGEFLKFKKIYAGAFRGYVGHLITHAHALVELEKMGYGSLARKGHDAHRLHAKMLRTIHDYHGRGMTLVSEPVTESPLQKTYWQRPMDANNWATGHYFKYCYHTFELLRQVDDPALRQNVVRQLGYLL